MAGCVQLRGNLKLHNMMTGRKFCMQLGNCKGLLLTGGSLFVLVVLKLIPYLSKNFAMFYALIMCPLG